MYLVGVGNEQGSQIGHRIIIVLIYVGMLALFAVPAIAALHDTTLWDADVHAQGVALIVMPIILLVFSVASRHHSLAWSIYWVFSLLFMGLAAAYQLGDGRFPWGARPSDEAVSAAQRIVIAAHLIVLIGFAIGAWRRQRKPAQEQEELTPSVLGGERLRKAATSLIVLHALIATVFIALMGAAMFAGRLAFQGQLAERGELPGFGTIYFLAIAGAVSIPPMAILLKKRGVAIPGFAVFLSVLLSFIVTNPLVGSRFLSGTFLVAIVAIAFSANIRRWIPLGLILVFVTVFPTLDVLRGDGTGAARVEPSSPAESLVSFDFDAFEMLVREVMMGGQIRGGLPTEMELLIAPFLRWIPGLSQLVQGDASGPVVAVSTGMGFTNVSMPLWGEAHLIGSWFGIVVAFLALGILLGRTRSSGGGDSSIFGALIEFPTAALLFIILRGSLYEVLGYLLLALAIAGILSRAERLDRTEPIVVTPTYHLVTPRTRRN